MDWELLLKQLQSGDWLGTSLAVWLSVFGMFFIPLMWFMLMIPIYIKTRSVIVVSVLTLLFASMIITALPVEFHKIAYILIVVSISTVFARVFIRW